MTDLAVDTRAIVADDPRYNCSLVRREDQHGSLAYFWVRFDGEPTPFEPGQYMTIGVMADERIVQRPYSIASSPTVAGDSGYEMYLAGAARFAAVVLPAYLVLGHLLCRAPVALAGALLGLAGFLLGTYAALFASWHRFF